MSGDPSVLTNEQLLHICATAFEEHAESIFVYAKDGRRLIAELRKRAAGTTPPTKQDIAAEVLEAVSDGEVVLRVNDVHHRSERRTDESWLPTPIPGKVNIRMSVVDDLALVTDMELGNAMPELAKRACQTLIDEHADGVTRRRGERS